MRKSSKTAATAATLADRLDGFLCFGVYSTGLAFNHTQEPDLPSANRRRAL